MPLVRDFLTTTAHEHGTPCYVYFTDQIQERIRSLHEVFKGRFKISYAVKSNPNLALLRWLRNQVEALDISSAGELDRALKTGWEPDRISFTGPGKRPEELEAAVKHRIGEVIVESVTEAQILNDLAAGQGQIQPILVRIAPSKMPRGFGVNMAGKPSQFGIDEEELASSLDQMTQLANLELVGFHIYSGTQCLDADSISENYEIFIDLFRQATQRTGISPRKLVFGAGIGIPYYDSDKSVDLASVAGRINGQLDDLKSSSSFSKTDLVLELGRYLVGEAGIYLTRVIAKKRSRGVDICICDGGMNHHLGACGHFGSVIHRNYRMMKVSDSNPEAELTPFELVGPLCTTIDTLGHGVMMPGLEVGDLIAVHCSGAYGASASPINFISHDPPKELMVDTDGRVSVV